MPQLDINTFTNQYLGIISTFIIFYVILSYLVLPTLLRLVYFRSSFMETRQLLNDSLTTTNPMFKTVLVLGSSLPNRLNFYLNRVLAITTTAARASLTALRPLLVTKSLDFNVATQLLNNLFTGVADFYLVLMLAHYELNS